LDQNFTNNLTRPHLAKKLSDNAYDAASLLGPKGDRELKQHVEEVFAIQHLRTDLGEKDQDDNDSKEGVYPVFSENPAETLLPDFLSLADSLGIKLVFYHAKRRPNADNVRPVPPALAAYTLAMKNWIEARGHYHVNETDSPAITLSMYQDFDHLKPEFYRRYTEIFASLVRPLLPTGFTQEELKQGALEMESLQRTGKLRANK
jgi:hypothetical protein